MKKIIFILIGTINILLFFQIISVYRDKDYSDIFNMDYGQHQAYFRQVLIHDDDGTVKPDDLFAIFQNITTETEGSMIFFSEHDFHENKFRTYISSNTPIDQRLGLVTDRSLHFHEDNTYFYTNLYGVENGVNFYLLNNQLDVRFSPISALETVRGGGYMFVALSQSDLDEMIENFTEQYSSIVADISDMDRDPLDVEAEIDAFLTPIILMSMFLLFILILMYIQRQSKKIAILKTMGFSAFSLFKFLFLPLTLGILLISILVNFILFVAIVGTINIRTIPIIWTLTHSIGYQFLGVVITLIIGNLLLLAIPTYSLLKNSNMNRFFMGANLVVKMTLLVFLLPILSGRLAEIGANVAQFQRAREYIDNGIGDYQLSMSFLMSYQNIEKNYWDLLFEVEGENLQNEKDLTEHQLIYDFYRGHEIINEVGAIRSNGSAIGLIGADTDYPFIIVNENYLNKHPLLDREGRKIDTSIIEEKGAVYLVPEIYMDKYTEEQLLHILGGDGNIILIGNEQNIFDYSLAWNWTGVSELPYIVRAYSDAYFRPDASIFQDMFYSGDMNELLEGTIFYDKIEISTVGEELERISSRSFHMILDNVLVLLPSLALVTVIIVQYASLYVKVFDKRIRGQKVVGYSTSRSLFPLFLESVMAVLASSLVAWYLQLDFQILFFIIVVEVIVYLVFALRNKWKFAYNE